MPANDPMYTYAQIEKLRRALPEGHQLYDTLNDIQKDAVSAASESARVVMDFFAILHEVMDNENESPDVRDAASKIFNGPYYMEIA